MTTTYLLEKAYGSFSNKTFEAMLRTLCKDLRAEIRVQGKTTRDWVQIEVTGEDEPVALRLLDREMGLAPVSRENVGKFSALRGKIVNSDISATELHVDIGVFAPRVYDAVVPLKRLQVQLADGKSLPLTRLIELFSLIDFAPLHVKILADLNVDKGMWQAELSEKQLLQFSDWLKSNLNRLIVLGASRKEVENAVDRAKHFRDIVKIEALGPFEHALVCKLGTDAVGLMPRLGSHLRRASFAPFSPRKIKEIVGW